MLLKCNLYTIFILIINNFYHNLFLIPYIYHKYLKNFNIQNSYVITVAPLLLPFLAYFKHLLYFHFKNHHVLFPFILKRAINNFFLSLYCFIFPFIFLLIIFLFPLVCISYSCEKF